MAWIAGDSFDMYTSVSDVGIPSGVWSAITGVFQLSASSSGLLPYGVGNALQNSGVSAASLRKDIGSNEATVFAAFSYVATDTVAGKVTYFTFRDGATAQCTVTMEADGSIKLRAGSETGTVLATYPSAFTLGTWAHFQIRVVIHNSTGSITVRKDGATSDSFTATGLNTRATANNYANVILFGYIAGSSGSVFRVLDNLLFYSGSGAAPNDWIGVVRALTVPPVADASIQWTPTPTTTFTFAPTASQPKNQVADTIYWSAFFTPTKSGTVTSLTIKNQTALTGTLQSGLYLGDGPGQQPGTLLATFTSLVNPGTGDIAIPFTAGMTLTQGWRYYLAVLANGSWATNFRSLVQGYRVAQSAAGGLPAVAPTVLTSETSGMWAGFALTGSVISVSEERQNTDTDFIFGSTVGLEDLYALPQLPLGLPVLAVQTRAFARKTDATARNAQVRVVSGATAVGGTDTPLATTYAYLGRVDAVDPDTGASWTIAGVNALKVGVKVTV